MSAVQVAQVLRRPGAWFCTVVPNICGRLLWNLLHVILLAPRIVRWLLDFLKIWSLLTYLRNNALVNRLSGIRHTSVVEYFKTAFLIKYHTRQNSFGYRVMPEVVSSSSSFVSSALSENLRNIAQKQWLEMATRTYSKDFCLLAQDLHY